MPQISGIGSAAKLRSPTGETVFLFGDVHVDYNDRLCGGEDAPNFIGVLERLISSANGAVDFYIEQDVISAGLTERSQIFSAHLDDITDHMLPKTWYHFLDCYSSEFSHYGVEGVARIKVNCSRKWPNLRYHYADIRTEPRYHSMSNYYVTKNGYISPPLYLYNNLESFIDMDPDTTSQDLIKITLNRYEYTWADLVTSPRIQKQLQSVDSTLGRRILSFMEKIFTLKYTKVQKRISQVLALIKKGTENAILFSFIDNYVLNPLLSLSATIMDLYLLLRMSRPFNGRSQEHVIIYGGVSHIKVYMKFLTSLGYQGHEYLSESEAVFRKDKSAEDVDDKLCVIVPDSFLRW